MLHIFSDASAIAEYVSTILVDRVKSKPEVVLGLATGGTMEPIYARFVEQAREIPLVATGDTKADIVARWYQNPRVFT